MKTNTLKVYLLIALLMTLLLGGLWNSFMMIPFTCSMIINVGGLYALAYNGCHNTRLLGTSFLLALLLSLPLVYSENTLPLIEWLVLLPFVFYIAHCFHATLHEKSSFNVAYTDLFHTVWNTCIVLCIAAFFTLLVNGLILLLVGMLKKAGIETSSLFNNTYYLVFRYLGLLIIGVGIIKQQAAIVYKTRFLALHLAWYIYPLIITFSLIALMLYGTSYYNKDNTAALLPFLVTFFALSILFFNAVFQTGRRLPIYPYWLHPLVKTYPIFLGCLAIILFYHAMKHVFLIRNMWLVATLLLLYGTSYAISAFLREDKAVYLIKATNVILAIYFVIAALIANSPVYTFMKPPASHENALSNTPFTHTFDHWQVSDEKKTELMTIFRQHTMLLKKNGLTWKPFYPARDLLPDNAEICQVPYKDGFEPGNIVEKKCVITYGGNILPVEQFLYLDKTHSTVNWQSKSAKNPVALGIEFIPDQMTSTNPEAYLRVLYVCKVVLNQHDYIGKVVGNYCNIAYQGEEKSMPNFQVLGS